MRKRKMKGSWIHRKWLLLTVLSVFCFQFAVADQALSIERQQQFTYYWYAAKQAIEEERYGDALVLLQFCEQLNPQDGSVKRFLGVMYDAMGQKERALASFKEAFEVAPHDEWRHYSRALIEQHSEQSLREALRVSEKALRCNPTDEDLLEQLLTLYINDRQWAKALQIQDRIDRQKGYDVYSAYNRMRVYAMWEKPKKAIAEIDRYLEQDPVNVTIMGYRVDIMQHHRIGKPSDWYDWYERILAITPGNLSALNDYAYLLATRGGDLQKAERMSRKTIQEEPRNAAYLDTYGWILYLRGENQLALFYLQKALDATSDARTEREIRQHIHTIQAK